MDYRQTIANKYSVRDYKDKKVDAKTAKEIRDYARECPKLVDSLKSRKPISINLEQLDSETGRKIFDFLGGATYALNGNVQKVANNIFVFAPENVAIFAEGENKPYSFGGEGGDQNPWK